MLTAGLSASALDLQRALNSAKDKKAAKLAVAKALEGQKEVQHAAMEGIMQRQHQVAADALKARMAPNTPAAGTKSAN